MFSSAANKATPFAFLTFSPHQLDPNPPDFSILQLRQPKSGANLTLLPPELRPPQSRLIIALHNLVLLRIIKLLLVRRIARPVPVVISPIFVVRLDLVLGILVSVVVLV